MLNCSLYNTIFFINDFDAFVEQFNPLLSIKFEYLKYFIDELNFPTNGIDNNTIKRNKEQFHKIYEYYGCDDFNVIRLYLKYKKHICDKCGRQLSKIQTGLLCRNCDEIHVCDICGDEFLCKQGLMYHYSVKHNKKKVYDLSHVKVYCIHCREELKVICNRSVVKCVNKCTNNNCIVSENTKRRRIETRRKNNPNGISEESRERYRLSALKREKIFRETILSNGMTLKQSIKKKSAMAQSKKMKDKIQSGQFTPNVTNSWCKSRCYINDTPFRSSWEAYFYLYNVTNDIRLEYEKVRIPYLYNENKHIYITDFQDYEKKIIYEIKPNSEFKNNTKIKCKQDAAILWCNHNGWQFVYITDDWFNLYYDECLLTCVTNEETKAKMFKNLKQFKGNVYED